MWRRSLPLVIVLMGFITYGAYPLVRPVFVWHRFVRRVKAEVDPLALQRWATNFLALHPDDYFFDVRGTNAPVDIIRLYRLRPSVATLPERRSVIIAWGRGHPSIHVGGPDFVSTNRAAQMWVPGVFLAKPTD